MFELAVETPNHLPPINIMLDVVDVDISVLLDLDDLDGHSLIVENVTNRLWERTMVSYDPLRLINDWSTDLRRVNDHIYVQMHLPSCNFYTTQQLVKLHRQFAHSSSTRLYNLLKRACIEAVGPDMQHKLEQIVSRCDPFQRINNSLFRFRVTLGQENVRFNSRVYMDLMHV